MEKIILRILVIAILASLALPAHSGDEDLNKETLASFTAVCAAYYLMTDNVLGERGGNEEARKTAVGAAGLMLDLATEMSNSDVTRSRAKLAIDQMHKEMKHDPSNFAILVDKYGRVCDPVLERVIHQMLNNEAKNLYLHLTLISFDYGFSYFVGE